MSGCVYLVGAGPGDRGLLTLRAVECLRRADVVIYDRLADAHILQLASAAAEYIYVGKAASHHTMCQEEINDLLVERAQSGHCVVRLKGGDPFVFGRGGEEALALQKLGLPFEIVPGVPSACAAAAAAGIPLTRRLTSRRVQFVTGADVTGDLPEGLNWAALADPKATTVVFMGKRTFPVLVAGLVAHGLSADTPVLMAEAVGHPEQRLIRSTLGALGASIAGEASGAPALILYGPLMEG